MAVRIRLKRIGKKKRPYYRVVIADSRCARNGRTIEDVGSYDPFLDQSQLSFNQERITYWLSVGAKPSDRVQRLLAQLEVVPKVVVTSSDQNISRKERRERAEKS